MKKFFIILLVSAMMCCLFAPALGAAASGDTKIINGNTYIYPNGFGNTVNNDIIIQKNYSLEDIRQAEEALDSVFRSLYYSDDKVLYNAISNDEMLIANCKYENWTPDFSTLYKVLTIDIASFSKAKNINELLNNPTRIDYRVMTKDAQGSYVGWESILKTDDGYEGTASMRFASKYITNDLRTHAVEIYALLKNSGLDLAKTNAACFSISDIGSFYMFSDGTVEFVTPIGYQLDYSPYEAGEGYPDASSSFQLIRGEEFMKAMVKVEQEVAEAKAANASYDGEPQMGGSAIDNTPALNGNTVLYIAIGCFAVAAASVVVYLVIRKRRTLNKT